MDSYCWHPDGRHLVVSASATNQEDRRLRAFDIHSRSWRDLLPLVPGTNSDLIPKVAPNGDSIAFVRKWSAGSEDLFVFDIDAGLNPLGPARQLTRERDRITRLEWTPDSRQLIFTARPLGHASIMRISASGGARRSLQGLGNEVQSLAIPLRAWKLAYSVYESDVNLWRLDLQGSTAPVSTQVVASTYTEEEAQVSPDGTRIDYDSNRSGTPQIRVSDIDGRNARQVTSLPDADVLAVYWSRDSRDLVISARQKLHGERIFLTPATGPPRLKQILPDAMVTGVSRDGRWFYFARRANRVRYIWKTEFPDPKTFIPVTTGPGETAKEAVDGKSVYFALRNQDDGLWQQPLPSGPAKKVVERLYRRNLFVPSSDGVYYIARIGDLEAPFFLNHFTGKTRQIVQFEQDIFWGLDLSPDEKSLYYSRFDVAKANIMHVPDFR